MSKYIEDLVDELKEKMTESDIKKITIFQEKIDRWMNKIIIWEYEMYGIIEKYGERRSDER